MKLIHLTILALTVCCGRALANVLLIYESRLLGETERLVSYGTCVPVRLLLRGRLSFVHVTEPATCATFSDRACSKETGSTLADDATVIQISDTARGYYKCESG